MADAAGDRVDGEALLAAIAQRRDKNAFVDLFAHWAPRIKAYLLTRKIAATTAEDLTQEVMLTVWRKAAQFRAERGAAGAWIFRIARNCLIDRIRHENRPEPDPGDPASVSTHQPTPEQQFAQAETSARVAQAIAALPSEQAEALRGVYFRGLTMHELAEEQGVPLGTFKTRVRLALVYLRGAVERPVQAGDPSSLLGRSI